MTLRRFTTTAALTIAAMGIATGVSHADPSSESGIDYTSQVAGTSVVTTIDAGSFTLSGDSVAIRDNAGNLLQTVPLAYRVGDRDVSVVPFVQGRSLTLTPTADSLPLTAVASKVENDAAFEQFGSQVSVAVSVGALVGTIVGAALGCVVGLPAGGVGCFPGMVTGGGIGGIVGTIAVGGPVLVGSGIELYNTWNAAPGTSEYAK